MGLGHIPKGIAVSCDITNGHELHDIDATFNRAVHQL